MLREYSEGNWEIHIEGPDGEDGIRRLARGVDELTGAYGRWPVEDDLEELDAESEYADYRFEYVARYEDDEVFAELPSAETAFSGRTMCSWSVDVYEKEHTISDECVVTITGTDPDEADAMKAEGYELLLDTLEDVLGYRPE